MHGIILIQLCLELGIESFSRIVVDPQRRSTRMTTEVMSPIFFLLAQKENGQKEKGHGNRNARGELPHTNPRFRPVTREPIFEAISVGSKSERTDSATYRTPPSISEARANRFAENIRNPKLPKSSAGAQGGIFCAFNFGANLQHIGKFNPLSCAEIAASGERITTSVMISEVLFGYFSRSWIPLIGGIQSAELFKESRVAGSKRRKSN